MPQYGDTVPSRFNPLIIMGSCFASFIGCVLTVEMLHRRGTGVRNLRSWQVFFSRNHSKDTTDFFTRMESFGCAVCLGLIGIWCMHFVGNRAIVLGDGSDPIQMVYSPGWSTFSAFLPVLGLSGAFLLAELPALSRSRTRHFIALLTSGIFAGASVVGMHYVGNLGISNYHLKYAHRFLAASVAIAVIDCIAVLMLFYTWREMWISDWRKRLICATLLAAGVSAMHFTASTKCIYEFKHHSPPEAIRSRNIQVIVAGILCAVTVAIIILVIITTQRRARVLKEAAQKVMVACAMFNSKGELLVTKEGVLPAREITDKYKHRTFNDEFDTSHPTFHWIFRVTRNWLAVIQLIPKMKSHLCAEHLNSNDDSRTRSSSSSTTYEPETYNDYSIIFRERFCTAAASLASAMDIPLARIGVLYDNIIETGTLKAEDRGWMRSTLSGIRALTDVESASPAELYGTGQLLLLTRQVTDDSMRHFSKAGFRFARYEHVRRRIANTMQIPLTTLDGHISSLSQYTKNLSHLEKAGTWLSFFAMIPKINSKQGFDVVVKTGEQDQVPDVLLLPHDPVQWQEDILARMHEKTSSDCIEFLEHVHNNVGYTNQEQNFALVVLNAMAELAKLVPESWFKLARFYGKQLQGNFSQPLRDSAPITVLYSFVACTDLHASLEGIHGITCIPISLLNTRQQCYTGSPNHAVLARDIHQEFAPLLARKTPKKAKKPNKLSVHIAKAGRRLNKITARRPSALRFSSGDSSEIFELDAYPQRTRQPSQAHSSIESAENSLGGIRVDRETIVKSDIRSEPSIHSHDHGFGFNMFTPSYGLGMNSAISTTQPEETFVDEIVAFARIITKLTN